MSALGNLFDTIKATFAAQAETSTVEVVFGERQRSRQNNQGVRVANRVVFEPLQSAKVGDLMPARQPGGNPRRVASMPVAATIYVWGYDGSTAAAAADERLQYEAVYTLFVQVIRALDALKAGEILFGSVEKVKPEKRERVLGQEWKFTIRVIDDLEAVAALAVIRDPKLVVTLQPLGG